MEITTIEVSKSVVSQIKDLQKDLEHKRVLKNEYKISVNEYMNHKQIFKERCRKLIPELYKVKMFHFSEDFLRVHYGKTKTVNT